MDGAAPRADISRVSRSPHATNRWSKRVSLTDLELDQLRTAELALSRAVDTETAARELAHHAIALLGAHSAVVLIEGIGDTVRVAVGPSNTEDVYGSGSRMRLLSDAGLTCGSIAVSPRADGRAYTPRHERLLDSLAERVSTTLQQLSLLTEVQTERQTLADLIGSTSDGIFSVASDLEVRSWNPAMEAITGVSAPVAIGAHVSETFRPRDGDGNVHHGMAGAARGAGASPALVSIDVGDEIRWLTCSYAPLADGGYVAIIRDDTERKKLQDDKDGWIAQVSHELRTPLTPIRGFLQTLIARDDQLTTEDRSRIYEIMLREELRLESLVNALLRSTQMDEADLVVIPQATDWAAIVHEEVLTQARVDPTRTITATIDPLVEPAMIDATMATTVLTALLSNAHKYAAPSTVEVVVEADGDELLTSVIDHGPGIARSDHDRIFDKFTRLGDHLTRREQGVGLGLYLARQTVERLDGRLWVDATPGGGTTFRFTLPMAVPTAEDENVRRPPQPTDRRGGRQLTAG